MRFEICPASLEIIQKFVFDFCEKNSIESKLKPKILVCADEIASNILSYSGASSGEINLSTEENEGIILTFSDDGKAFNPLEETETPDIKSGLEKRKAGGLGVYIVRKMSESAEYHRKDNLNVLKIIFRGGNS